MGSIIGIPSTRVSDIFVRQRTTDQILYDQVELLRIQTQLSTGRRIQLPSEDAGASQRIISLQRLLEQKSQIQANLSTNQSFLAATDAALSTLSSTLAEVRGIALGAIGTDASDQQRQTAALQVQEALRELLGVANQDFRDRYLFAGTGTALQPFEATGSNLIRYVGNEGRLSSYSDVGALFDTNLHGSEVFGAISDGVQPAADLDPILTFGTRLADLRGGLGINCGSIIISSGGSSATVDLSSAATIGDVAAMIRAGCGSIAPDVEITPTGLKIIGGTGQLLTIRDAAGSSTARELGILTTTPVSTVLGGDLNPIVRLTTRLDDMMGARSYAVARSGGADNDIIFEADTVGAACDGIKIVFQDDNSVVMCGVDERASYDSVTRTLTVTVKAGETQARHVVAAVEAAYTLGTVPLTARLDPLDEQSDGRGLIDVTPPGEVAGQTGGGSGAAFDRQSGLQIQNGGGTQVVSLADAQTVEDLLNALNASPLGLLAEINRGGTGINVRSRISGADFTIGENGGTTATQLGLRTLTADTRLDGLNYGRGVADQTGADFTITRSDGLEIEVDISGLETVGEVVERINALGGGTLQARLALYGNGIELVDQAAGGGVLTVAVNSTNTAAIALGLIPAGQQSSTSASSGTMSGGSQVLTGSDVNPLETEGIFTALSRLQAALEAGDLTEVQRALDMLDRQRAEMDSAWAELGARQQRLENVQQRLASEEIDLRATLSQDLDADLTEAVSELAARQVAFEAALKSTAGILQMSLLDYL